MMGKAHLAKKVVEPVVETIPDNGLIGNDGIGNASNEEMFAFSEAVAGTGSIKDTVKDLAKVAK